jgi:aspartate-semialdehyde dehydrogenase
MPRIAVIGATGAVGLLAERGFEDVRALASSRSAGKTVAFGGRKLEVQEATPANLAEGGLDLCFFSVGTEASRELVPPAVAGGAVAIDKSDAYRLGEGIPLVVAGVNDDVLNGDEIVANPNCSAIQLACILKPLYEAAGLARVRLATYQSMSGAGDAGIERLRATAPAEADLAMDWELEGDEFTEESKLRAETRKILGLPQLPIQATCVRVPVLVGHAQAIWVETEEPLAPEEASQVLASAPHVTLQHLATPRDAAGRDEVLVGRVRRDVTDKRGLALWTLCDNLRKGAALNAVQIAETLLERRLLPA